MASKFLDPRNDFAFKKIFGTPDHKEILIHFLKAEGKAEGRAEGSKQTALQIAQKLVSTGMDSNQVAAITGLSLQELWDHGLK